MVEAAGVKEQEEKPVYDLHKFIDPLLSSLEPLPFVGGELPRQGFFDVVSNSKLIQLCSGSLNNAVRTIRNGPVIYRPGTLPLPFMPGIVSEEASELRSINSDEEATLFLRGFLSTGPVSIADHGYGWCYFGIDYMDRYKVMPEWIAAANVELQRIAAEVEYAQPVHALAHINLTEVARQKFIAYDHVGPSGEGKASYAGPAVLAYVKIRDVRLGRPIVVTEDFQFVQSAWCLRRQTSEQRGDVQYNMEDNHASMLEWLAIQGIFRLRTEGRWNFNDQREGKPPVQKDKMHWFWEAWGYKASSLARSATGRSYLKQLLVTVGPAAADAYPNNTVFFLWYWTSNVWYLTPLSRSGKRIKRLLTAPVPRTEEGCASFLTTLSPTTSVSQELSGYIVAGDFWDAYYSYTLPMALEKYELKEELEKFNRLQTVQEEDPE